MPKQTKPKWGSNGVSKVLRMPLSQNAIASIEKETGIKFEPRLSDQLNRVCQEFISTKQVTDGMPRASEVRAALSAIKKLAQDFENALSEVDFVTKGVLNAPSILESVKKILTFESDRVDIEGTRLRVQIIRHAAERGLDIIPVDKGGRPQNKALRRFIDQIAQIYRKATKKEPSITFNHYNSSESYTGKFYHLVESCLKEISPEDIYSNSSLGQAIKAALERRKEPHT